MIGAAQNTRLAAAGDLCRFLCFLHESRGGKSWRDAQEDDHAAFLHWRQLMPANPVPQRARRAAADRHRQGDGRALVPAAQARDTGRDEVKWLAPAEYRQWRNTGLRGYRADGLPDEGFRGRWASRNALFADVMVRTGLRLAEQASLTDGEAPAGDGGVAYQRFWLPGAVAKNGSSRWVYPPAALARKVGEYCAADRAEIIIAAARRRGTYDRIRDPLVIDPALGPASAVVVRRPDGGEAVIRVEQLTPGERARLLVRTRDRLKPAGLWLAEHGMPVSISGWKGIFRGASSRCARAGVPGRLPPAYAQAHVRGGDPGAVAARPHRRACGHDAGAARPVPAGLRRPAGLGAPPAWPPFR